MLSSSGIGNFGSFAWAAKVIPGWCFGPCDARGSLCEAEYDCCVIFGGERSASETGGCEFANDSLRDLGMVKVRTVMFKWFLVR